MRLVAEQAEDARPDGLFARALRRHYPLGELQTAGELQPASFQVAEIFAQLGISLLLGLPGAMIGVLVAFQCLVAEGFVAGWSGLECGFTQCRIIKRSAAEFW